MSAPRKTKRKAQEASISISEFKQWLSGVEDMQEPGWVPDAAQWTKIRAKVELLADEEIQAEQYTSVPAYSPNPGFVPGAPIPYVPPAQQDYASLTQNTPQQPRARQSAMLLDDGITMPFKTPQDAAFDQGLPMHVADQFS